MKFKSVGLLIVALGLGACSSASSLLDTKQMVPQGTVATNNPLSLPPDLQLPAPGTATAASYAAPPATPTTSAPLKAAAPANNLYGTPPVAAAAPIGDVFDQNGISKVKPDGTKKTPAELNQELSQALIAKKRKTNPSYGTIGNIGAIFSDN